MRVTSKKSVSFPKFNWGINKGKCKELPKDEKIAKEILKHPAISETKPKLVEEKNSENIIKNIK